VLPRPPTGRPSERWPAGRKDFKRDGRFCFGSDPFGYNFSKKLSRLRRPARSLHPSLMTPFRCAAPPPLNVGTTTPTNRPRCLTRSNRMLFGTRVKQSGWPGLLGSSTFAAPSGSNSRSDLKASMSAATSTSSSDPPLLASPTLRQTNAFRVEGDELIGAHHPSDTEDV
jgi:hypothetical protein